MSPDQESDGVYLTSRRQLHALRITKNDETTTQKEKPDYVSYYLEGSLPSSPISRQYSVDDEYVLAYPEKNDRSQGSDDNLSSTPQLRQKKAVVQDIYDEDHYCLARASGFQPHDIVTCAGDGGRKKDSDIPSKEIKQCSCTKKNRIFGTIIGMLLLCIIGGVIGFSYLNQQGTLTLSI